MESLLRLPSFIAAVVIAFGATAQNPEHRPVRPKGRYFTQDQLQRALRGAKTGPAKAGEQQPTTPPSEMAKSLLDFAKQNPELAKSLLEAAQNLAKENPDLFRGGNDEAAKRLAEQMAKQSNFGDLLKNLDQKPPPSNVKRKPSEKTDEKGRRSRNKKDAEGETNPQEQPREDSKGRPSPQPRPTPDSETDSPKKERSPLADLAGQSPDFVKSLLDQAKMKAQNGRPPTKKQIDDAIKKATEEMKHDPAYADWIRNPQTQEKIRSPKLRDEVMKQLTPPKNTSRRTPQPDAKSEEQPQPEKPPPLEPYREPFKSQPDQPDEQRPRDPLEDRPKSDPNRTKGMADSFLKEQMRKADAARKAVAKEREEQGRTPGDREPIKEEGKDPSIEQPASPNIEQLAELLKQNPGLVESVVKSAGGGEGGSQESLKGMLDALKGTGLERQFRDLAKELNKDGSLNDLMKGRGDSQQIGQTSPRNRPREDATPPPRSTAEEASKAFKSLAGEDFNASKLGDAMKSLGAAIKKQTAAEDEQSWSPSRGQASKTAGDGLGEGWLGALSRGAAKVGEWGASATQKLSQQVAPGLETPRIDPPAFSELRSLAMPTAETGGKMLLVFGIIAAIACGVWMLLRRTETVLGGGPLLARLPKLSLAGLPPREQAALLFERAALERLGEPARPKNHVALAEKLCNGKEQDSHLLAEVYEAARYTPPTDPFQPDNVSVVREIIARNRAVGKANDGGK
jgi:hypothetical protein